MGQAVTDISDEYPLGDFEGIPVVGAGVEVRNASGGLNDALGIDPVVMQKGDMAIVVLRVDVTDVHFPDVKGEEGTCIRAHVMRATDAAIVTDEALSKKILKVLNDQREKIVEDQRKKAEAKKGQLTLTGDGGADEPIDDGEPGDPD